MIDIFSNPVIIGLLVGILTYMYLWWKNEEAYKKYPKNNRKTSILIPIATTVVTFILAYGYNYNLEQQLSGGGSANIGSNQVEHNLGGNLSDNLNESFHLVSKGVNIPNNLKLPDVFIETQ